MKLKLRRVDWLDERTDLYVIECEDGSRLGDAHVEGSVSEMRAIAQAIIDRERVSFGYCAVDARKDRVLFWSPRNSEIPGVSSLSAASDLATEIVARARSAA